MTCKIVDTSDFKPFETNCSARGERAFTDNDFRSCILKRTKVNKLQGWALYRVEDSELVYKGWVCAPANTSNKKIYDWITE